MSKKHCRHTRRQSLRARRSRPCRLPNRPHGAAKEEKDLLDKPHNSNNRSSNNNSAVGYATSVEDRWREGTGRYGESEASFRRFAIPCYDDSCGPLSASVLSPF